MLGPPIHVKFDHRMFASPGARCTTPAAYTEWYWSVLLGS